MSNLAANIISINNYEVEEKYYQNKKVLTSKDIDGVHNRPYGTAKRNYNDNKKYFLENEDYFLIKGEELREFKQSTKTIPSTTKELMLFTEQGYKLLIKTFTDPKAWNIQRELVNVYFLNSSLHSSQNLDFMQSIVNEFKAQKKQLAEIAETIINTTENTNSMFTILESRILKLENDSIPMKPYINKRQRVSDVVMNKMINHYKGRCTDDWTPTIESIAKSLRYETLKTIKAIADADFYNPTGGTGKGIDNIGGIRNEFCNNYISYYYTGEMYYQGYKK